MIFTLLGGVSSKEEVYAVLKKAEPHLANKGLVLTDYVGFATDDASMIAVTICQDLGLNVSIYPQQITPYSLVKSVNDLNIQIVITLDDSIITGGSAGVKHSWMHVGVKSESSTLKSIKLRSRFFKIEGDTVWPTQSRNNIRSRKNLSRLQIPKGRKHSLL